MNEPSDVRLVADTKTSPADLQMRVATATTHPFVTSFSGEADRDAILAELGPGGTVLAERRFRSSGGTDRLVAGEGWMTNIDSIRPPEVLVHVAAVNVELLDEIATYFEKAFPKPAVDDHSVAITCTYDSHPASKSKVHRIPTTPWHDVAHNYPGRVRSSIERLVQVERPTGQGRLVLLHGPPGTGKSHLLRTIAREWSGWADTVFVTDPEALLTRTAYLYEVLDKHPGGNRWMLVIIEDAAELLGETSTARMHPGLAKMLNLSDGMLGDALGLIIAITTNEPLHRIHPAITRPGRCLANIHLDGFTRAEARQRLADHPLPDGDRIMLSEIIQAEHAHRQIIEEQPSLVPGVYV
ncbi:MAG: DUF5925 domain-containing protein [Acidimicrobiales bacterium]|nr:DUF5925 domain-containing protein [Acidimicrobiales bacterium]